MSFFAILHLYLQLVWLSVIAFKTYRQATELVLQKLQSELTNQKWKLSSPVSPRSSWAQTVPALLGAGTEFTALRSSGNLPCPKDFPIMYVRLIGCPIYIKKLFKLRTTLGSPLSAQPYGKNLWIWGNDSNWHHWSQRSKADGWMSATLLNWPNASRIIWKRSDGKRA